MDGKTNELSHFMKPKQLEPFTPRSEYYEPPSSTDDEMVFFPPRDPLMRESYTYENLEEFKQAFKDYTLKKEQYGTTVDEDEIRETRKETRTIHT